MMKDKGSKTLHENLVKRMNILKRKQSEVRKKNNLPDVELQKRFVQVENMLKLEMYQ